MEVDLTELRGYCMSHPEYETLVELVLAYCCCSPRSDTAHFDVPAHIREVTILLVLGGMPYVCRPVSVGVLGYCQFADRCGNQGSPVVLHAIGVIVRGVLL